ncbi:MAG: response regulator transcription factor [Lachnospiraceae bacterium]|nr:response regulator transcription factor [Lachnospiraceae bacterium]
MANKTVLICDDNPVMHDSLSAYLKPEKINVISTFDGESALEQLKTNHVDVVVLDIMLPGIDGLEVCRQIRRFSDIHIIMISAKGDNVDRIVGLEVGADDYLSKPVSPREVLIRIKKAIKRSERNPDQKTFTLAELKVLPDSYQVFLNGEEIILTSKETELLTFLISNAGKVLTREHILNAVWGYEYCGDTRAVDTLVKRLRQKLLRNDVHFVIRSVYGVGYIIEEKK